MSVALHNRFQGFVGRILAKASSRARRKKKSIRRILEQIRTIAGERLGDVSVSSKKTEVVTGQRFPPPSPDLIEFVRIEIQHMINPESRYMHPSTKFMKAKHCLYESDEQKMVDFLKDSMNWVALVSLDQSLTLAADQSAFYFKEVHLDLDKVVQFPIRSSIPFILCQFALENYGQPEVTEVIFYPLSIYDDAAHIALNTHKSKMIFDEVRAEAEMCRKTLAVLIGEFTFNAFRTYATLKKLPDRTIQHLKRLHEKRWPKSQAYRLRSLLQQNQYHLLSRQLPLQSMIAPRVDQELNNSVARVYQIAQDLGVIGALAINRAMSIIRETHRMLIEQGLPLMPLKDVERTAKWDNDPQSFFSKFLHDVSHHLFRQVVPKYKLWVNPMRLVPQKKVQLPAEPLGKLVLGRFLKDALEPTVGFVTVQHFSGLVRQLSEGSMVLLAKDIQDQIVKLTNNFIDCYSAVYTRLPRIKDSPFGASAYTAFSRYEGAYRFFLDDKDVNDLLRSMQSLGNALAVVDMLDDACALKSFHAVQILGFLRSVDANGHPKDLIEGIMGKEMAEGVAIIKRRPLGIPEGGRRLFMSLSLATFCDIFRMSIGMFAEPDVKTQDATSMRGFSAIWSVLEFVLNLMEATRIQDQITGFAQFGMGPVVCAALVISVADQIDLSKLMCISRRMLRHHQTDLSGMSADNEKIQRFLAACQMTIATVEWAFVFFEPFLRGSS
jgi:hypothetical protein